MTQNAEGPDMSDIAASAVAMKTAQTRHMAQLLIVKKQHEMEMSLVAMLDKAVRPPAPAGMGAVVDKSA